MADNEKFVMVLKNIGAGKDAYFPYRKSLDIAKEFAKTASDLVNPFGWKATETYDTIVREDVEDIFDMVAYGWLLTNHFYYAHNLFDDRNEYAVKTAEKVFQNDAVRKKAFDYFKVTEDLMEEIMTNNSRNGVYLDKLCEKTGQDYEILEGVVFLSREHRALYSSFASLVFTYLDKEDDDVQDMVSNGDLYPDWTRC